MKKIILFLFLSSTFVFSQTDFENYKNIKCEGVLPSVFTGSLKEKIEKHKEEILDKKDKFSEKRLKKQFSLASNYQLREIILNGQVSFGDTLTNYVNQVSQNILKNYEFSKKENLEFYVFKSSQINSFTSDDGKIFISIGLLAQLETEAQLAYVLCREISHFIKQHAFSGYRFKRSYNGLYNGVFNNKDAFLIKSNFDQKKELIADSMGLKIFLKSDYGVASLNGVFDILQFSYLPIDEIEFEPYLFENKNYKIRKELLLDSVNSIIQINSKKQKSTYNKIKARKDKFKNLLQEKQRKGKQFVFPKDRFFNSRNIARFELTQILLERRMYQALLYNNYVLFKDFPNNSYLIKTTSKALYYLSKYKLRGLDNVIDTSQSIQGESHRLYYLFQNISDLELALITVNYIWESYQKLPHLKELHDMASEILNEVVYLKKLDKELFLRKSKEGLIVQNKVSGKERYERSRKYKRIAEKKVKKRESQKIYNIFVDLFLDQKFSDIFDFSFSNAIRLRDGGQVVDQPQKKSKDNSVWNNKAQVKLGIDSIFFVDPTHFIVDVRKKTKLQILETDKKQKEASDAIKKVADLLDLHVEMFDSKNLNIDETIKFNQIIMLKKMIREINIHYKLDSLVLGDLSHLNSLSDNFGISNVAWNLMITVIDDKESQHKWRGTGLEVLAMPYIFHDSAMLNKTTYNSLFVFDFKKGEVVFVNKSKMIGRYPKSIIKQNMYYNLAQIKK